MWGGLSRELRTGGVGCGNHRATFPGAGVDAPRWESVWRVSGAVRSSIRARSAGEARGTVRQREIGIHQLGLLPWQPGGPLPCLHRGATQFDL